VVRAPLLADDDPQSKLSNLIQNASLARVGIAVELGIVLAQALTALWFYRLFRSVEAFAATWPTMPWPFGLDPGLGRCGLPGPRPRQLPVPNRRQQPADPSRRLPARSGSRDS